MKVLITGCTASHASKNTNEKNPSFAGIINIALTELGFDVTWQDPSVTMNKDYLSQYDSILVGISKPTGIASHRVYGALSVINHASDLGTLSLFMDTIDPHKLYFSLGDIYRKPDSFFGSFHSKKREYKLAQEPKNYENVIEGAKKLYGNAWPKTIIPSYPWSKEEVVTKYIPNVDRTKLFLVSPDAALLEISNPIQNYADGSYWCIDNPKTDWYRKVSVSLSNSQVNYRATKWEGNKDILARLNNSMGALVSVYKSGNPWWFPTLSQALYVGVPAVTDWRLTTSMGPEWSVLPHAIEEMSPIERVELSKKQKESYTQNIPSWESVKENIGNILLQK